MGSLKALVLPVNTLKSTLFSLATLRPPHKENLKYVNLGPFLQKKKLYRFIEVVKRDMNIDIDPIVFSRICIEVSEIDDSLYIEISLDKRCELPIAGNQYQLLAREASEFDMSLDGYITSLNFILNDERNFKDI